jgi:type I restriction enzyme S subunit
LPKGWELCPLNKVLHFAYGKALPKTAREDGDVPVYGSGGIVGTHNRALVKGPGIIVGRKGTVGSLFWESRDFYPIDTVFFVKPEPGVSLHFAWALLRTLGLETMNTDAAVPGLNRNNAHRLNAVHPGQPLIEAFGSLVEKLRDKMDTAEAENRILAETRDYILPPLMSGKIRVAEAERIAG